MKQIPFSLSRSIHTRKVQSICENFVNLEKSSKNQFESLPKLEALAG